MRLMLTYHVIYVLPQSATVCLSYKLGVADDFVKITSDTS
jgi:hypothetical protein